MTITELSIKRPSLIVVIFSALSVIGIASFQKLEYDLLPRIESPVLNIRTQYPGASANEVEFSVTKLLENAISGLDQVAEIRATSQEGFSQVAVEFQPSADLDLQMQEAQRKLNAVLNRLPDGAQFPTLTRFTTDDIPILRIGVTSAIPPKDFRQFLEDRIGPRFFKVAGVAQVSLVGGEEREIFVSINPQKLQGYDLSLAQVTQAIQSANLETPVGKLEDERSEYVVRMVGKFSSLEQLRQLVIRESSSGGVIRLGAIAEVYDGSKEASSLTRVNGQPSVGIIVLKQADANAVEVSHLVREQLKQLENEYRNLQLNFTIAYDGSLFTLRAAEAVKLDLGLAILLVALVMFLFLHSLRNSLIVLVAIPASLMSAFIAMYALGLSLNLMTLLAMNLVIGILVDDSIVVLENIHHHLEKGEPSPLAALKGRNEIGFAALSITLVDVVVFVPLIGLEGRVGFFVREFAIVVVISTLSSLFVCFTITPMLASRFMRRERLSSKNFFGAIALGFEKLLHGLMDQYRQILTWCLRHSWMVIGGCAFLVGVSWQLVTQGWIGSEFITPTDRGEFVVSLELAPGTALEVTDRYTQIIEAELKKKPEVNNIFTTVGSGGSGFGSPPNGALADISVTLVPREERAFSTEDFIRELRRKLPPMPGVRLRMTPTNLPGTGGGGAPIQVVVSGSQHQEVRDAAQNAMAIIRQVPGAIDVRLSSEEGQPEVQVELDREKLARLGLTLAEVSEALKVAFQGNDEATFRQGSQDYPIRIILERDQRSGLKNIDDLTIRNKFGELIQVKQFAQVTYGIGPTKLERQNRSPAVRIFARAVGRPSGSVGLDIQKALAAHGFPPQIQFEYQGDLKNQADSFASLGYALFAAILFVYMIMVALYDSYLHPFVVLFSIPVALIGALLALALSMKSFSIFSLLGMIMLVGLVGKNAILLVDRANQMREEHGLDPIAALLEAGQSRLRPILMTTIAMVIGMIPVAMHAASGAEWKSGLAYALIGGLLSSLLLTLVLVPAVYWQMTRLHEWFMPRWERWNATPDSPEEASRGKSLKS